MTSKEEHLKKIKEHLEEIEDAIEEGAEKKPVTIGFHCSSCALQFLELYLHKLNKISIGKVVKHDWFKKPQLDQKIEPLIERKLPIEFEHKKEVYELIYIIEEQRNKLVYGSPYEKEIKSIINNFNKLKELFKEILKDDIKI
jgi:hypothetical protein